MSLTLPASGGDVFSHAGLYWHFVDMVWMYFFPLCYLITQEIMERNEGEGISIVGYRTHIITRVALLPLLTLIILFTFSNVLFRAG